MKKKRTKLADKKELKQPSKLKAAEKERMKRQTSCSPTVEQIAVNDDQEDEQEQLSPESKTASQTYPKLTSLKQMKQKLGSTPDNHLGTEKLSLDQRNVNIGNPPMHTRRTVKRNSQELYSQIDVVTDMPQVTKEHPSPTKKKKKAISKSPTLGAIINEEVYMDEPLSETPSQKLSLIAKQQETKTVELSELEQIRDAPTALNKVGEKKDSLKLTSSETNPSEKMKEIQDSPSEFIANSSECSLTFAGIISHNPLLMESSFDVRYLFVIEFNQLSNFKLAFLEREVYHAEV